jgi:phosphonate transport system substrate-binding protein
MKFLKYILYLSPTIFVIAFLSSQELKESQLGSRSNPIRFYFTPSVDASTISQNASKLTNFLEKETGYYFTSAVPTSYVAVVEAFGTKKADVAILNTFSYLLAHEKYGVQALLRGVRRDGETSYCGQIVVRTDSGIDSLSQLEGKTIAYVDPSSTSGYLMPKALLLKHNIKTSGEVFAMKHDNVVTMVYQKQVNAGATYYAPRDKKTGDILDARLRVREQYPDVERKIKILALTDMIPNDPCIFRKDLPEDMKEKITAALLKFVSTPEGSHAMEEINSIIGLIPTKDKDYDVLRNMLASLNISLTDLAK